MTHYPRVIENGAGEQLTFLRRVQDEAGERIEAENCVAPGAGPPMHVHHLQEECLTVREGRLGYQRLGEEPQFAEPGETVLFKAGEAHRFWNAGEGEMRCSGFIRPPHNVEYFLSAIFESMKQNGGKQPDPFDAAFLMRRYRSEFDMQEIPPFVKRFIFPLQVAIGRLLGKYRKFKDAPEPIGAAKAPGAPSAA